MALLEAFLQGFVTWFVCHRPLQSVAATTALQADLPRSIIAQAWR
jgi:hypothetical protein